MRTIVGDSTKNTKDIKHGKVVNLEPNKLPVPTNVSQYGSGTLDIRDLETAKHWASEAEKSAKDAENSANKAEDFMDKTIEASEGIEENLETSHGYLEEIKAISKKIDGQEVNIDTLEKSTVSNAAHAEAGAKIASDSAAQARASEANAAASASSANNSAVSSKESEQAAFLSKEYAIAAATKGHQILAQTEAVYDKTIDDVSQAVQSYLKDKGGFDPAAGLPKPDSWFDIFGVEKKLSCLWTADVAGTIPETGVGFNAGDILIYNAIVDRYGRFSGELVTGGGGGGPTEFFNDIKLAADKRLLGTDSKGSAVELIKLVNDIVEAGDKTKPMHILAKDPTSAFVCVANSSTGFDNYQIYHEGNKPTPGALGAYTKTEVDNKFVDLAGTSTMTGPLTTTDTVYIKSKEVYHPGNKPPASDLDAVSLTKDEEITGRKKFTKNPIIENISPQISLMEGDTNTEVAIKVDSKKLTLSTPTSTPLEVDFNNTSVTMSNPVVKTLQGTSANSVVRKDHLDVELDKKLNKTGNPTISSDLTVTGKITVEGTGSIFKDINTTGQIKENNIRVYSPANKPNAIDVGALPISGGSVGGALHVVGNITTDAFISAKGNIASEGVIFEKSQRVYSPNNKPTPSDLGVLAARKSLGAGADLNTVITDGLFHGYGWVNGPTDSIAAVDVKRYSADWLVQKFHDIATGIQWQRRWYNANTWSAWAKVYDTLNKPTAADVGAIGIDNVYDKTQADERFWKRTETVNRAFSADAVNSYSKHSGDFKDVTNLRSYNVVPGNAGYPNLGSGFFQGRMDGLSNQGWSLFNEYNTNRFYFGKQKEDGSGFDWAKIYTEAQKPSAGDVGALPLTGGIMTGPMVMAPNSTLDGHNTVARYDGVTSYTHYYSDIGGVRTYHNFRFATGNGSMIAYVMDGSGSFSSNEGRFYSQGFRPSWAEVGGEQFLYKNEGHTQVGGGAWLRAATDSTGFIPANSVAGGVSSVGFPGWYFKDSYITNMKSSNIDNDSHLVTSSARVKGHLQLADAAGTLKGFFTAGDGEQPYWGFASGGSHHKIHHTGDFVVDIENTSNTVVRRDDVSGIIANHMTFPGDFRTIFAPSGGQHSGNPSDLGSIKISLPVSNSSTMMKVYVSVFNYLDDTSFDAILSGYNYGGTGTGVSLWHNCSAVITGGSATPNHPIYFGNEGGKDCIWIGSVGQYWAYSKIRITKVDVGHSNHDWRWSRDWSIGFVTSLGTVDRTISDALIKPGGGNTPSDEQPTPNTLVKRNASGNISAKGRILLASTNDSDVGTGTCSMDFVSSAGNVFGQVGDTDQWANMNVKSLSGHLVLDGALGTSIQQNGVELILSDTTSTKIRNTLELPLVSGKAIISCPNLPSANKQVINAGTDGGVYFGNPEVSAVYLENNTGVVYSNGPQGKHRIYHQGFKPTPDEIGALAIGNTAACAYTTQVHDTRGANRPPSFYEGNKSRFDFVESGVLGCGGDYWTGLQTVNPWVNFGNDHRPQQLAFTGSGGLSFRFATSADTWGNWGKVYSELNKPTAAEIGAHEVKPWISSPGMDANTVGNYSAFTYANNAPLNGSIVSLGDPGYCMQFNSNYGGIPYLHFRTRNGDNSSWNSWREVAFLNSNGTFSNGSIMLSGQDITIHGKRGMVGDSGRNKLVLNYGNDFAGGTEVNGGLWADTISGGMITGHTRGNNYASCGIVTNGDGGGNIPMIGFHHPGVYAGTIEMADWSTFRFTNQDRSGTLNVEANTYTAYGHLRFRPADGVSVLDFQNTGVNNDRGWIKHQNNSTNPAYMQFCVSDDPQEGSQDYFEFGAAVGNSAGLDVAFTQWVHIGSAGLTCRNNITAYSDRRVKTDIQNIPNALEKVMKLNGVTYKRTDTGSDAKHTGVIAQEVEAVLPEAVITSENGDIKDFKSVAYGNLVGLLIEAIKELKQEVEELKAR